MERKIYQLREKNPAGRDFIIGQSYNITRLRENAKRVLKNAKKNRFNELDFYIAQVEIIDKKWQVIPGTEISIGL